MVWLASKELREQIQPIAFLGKESFMKHQAY